LRRVARSGAAAPFRSGSRRAASRGQAGLRASRRGSCCGTSTSRSCTGSRPTSSTAATRR
jgi:hypothetical protein